MNGLTADQVDELRTLIERQIARLERSMKLTDEAARPVELDQTAVGRLSRMDALQNQHLTKNLQEREQVRYAMLCRALDRLEAGAYGRCETCDGPIGFDRLSVFPETAECGGCPAT